MAAPPFPVPAGLDWDPIKKRFFKALPAKAKVEPKSQPSAAQERKERKFARLEPISPSPFAFCQSYPKHLPHRYDSLSLRSAAPSVSDVQRHKRLRTQCNTIAHAKHVSTTTIIPWSRQESWRPIEAARQDEEPAIRISSIYSPSHLGSLLFFCNGSGDVFLTDTSHVIQLESSCAISHVFDYWSKPLHHQPEITTTINWDNVKCISDLRLPCEVTKNGCISFDETRLATITEDRLVIYEIGNFQQQNNLPQRSYQSRVLARLKVKPRQIRILCVRKVLNRTLMAYASQRQVGLLYDVGESSQDRTRANWEIGYQNLESDVMSLEVLPGGTTVLVGLRNGKVLRYSRKRFLESRTVQPHPSRFRGSSQECVIEMPKGIKSLHPSISKATTLELPGRGAVTNIKAVSDQEVIIAYTTGQILLINPDKSGEVIRELQGHVNSWSFDLPMCVDIPNRLLAIAGQDRRVRIWSLDDPTPLHHRNSSSQTEQSNDDVDDDDDLNLAQQSLSIKSLQDTTFHAPITGLTFCQRRYVANLEGRLNESFLERGLPGLAVACGGNQIGFFE